MLVRLLYVSKEIAAPPTNFAELNLEKFRINNQLNDITGWSMDYIPISTLYPLIKIENPEFDPYLSSGKIIISCVLEYLRLNEEH